MLPQFILFDAGLSSELGCCPLESMAVAVLGFSAFRGTIQTCCTVSRPECASVLPQEDLQVGTLLETNMETHITPF